MRAKYYIYTVDGREVRALTKLHANGEDAAREPAIDKTIGGEKRVRLTGVSADQKQVRLEILPSIETETQQAITTSVSTKPYIWVLWLGSVLVCVGTLVALRK